MICPACRADNDESTENCFSCGKGLFALTQGAVLNDRYEIRKPLGKGGMGIVYLAHDRELDEQVAVKVLRADLARSSDMLKRLRSEIKLARKVRHPNVCAIHEYGQHGHVRYIVMEYVEGVDLKQVLNQGALAATAAVDIAIQVAEALQAIHAVGIVHRDLKTPNIMRHASGAVRLMDFGIAKSYDSGTDGATATGQIIGTPEYMSPEQVRGERLDAGSDLYALGIVLFELLTGDVPFRADSAMATLMKHLHETPPLDRPGARSVPPEILPVLRRALAKERSDRFASAREFADALGGVRDRLAGAGGLVVPPAIPGAVAPRLAAEAAPTPVPTAHPTAAPTVTRHRAPAPLPPQPEPRASLARRLRLAAPAAVVVVAVILWQWARRSVPPGPPPSPVPAEATPPPAAAAPAPAGGEALPSVEPSASPPLPTPSPKRPERSSSVERPGVRPPGPGPAVAPTGPPAAGNLEVGEATGEVKLVVAPWAQVTVDGRSLGSSPLKPVRLSPGSHVFVFEHPDYFPLQRKVVVKTGEVVQVDVDLRDVGFPRKKTKG